MDYPRYEAIKLEKQGDIAIITLNRPELLMHAGHRELEELWALIAQDDEVKVIILTGAGDTFSAGGDVKAMAARAGTVEGLKYTLKVPAQTKRMLQNILDVPQPIIAAVNGDAVGLGATLALFADISVISETAKFGDTHVKVGLVAGDGGTVIWPLLIGPARAKELLMRGKLIDGKEAEHLNLVNYAVPREEVLGKSMDLAKELARGPVWAVRWTKMSVNQWIKHQLNLLLDGSIAFEMLSMNTHDHAEAARAFAEKRRPEFKGY
jgi:enoyl-CoA hydratase